MIERRLLARGVPAHDARIEASRLKAAFTGLTLDLVATGDPQRLTETLERIPADFERPLGLPNRPPAGATERRRS